MEETDIKPYIMPGTGFGSNGELSNFVDKLIKDGIIEEKGGVMAPGVRLHYKSVSKNKRV